MYDFKSYKGRSIKEGDKVRVYKNLHNGLFSIKDVKSGLVVGHVEIINLENVEFKVSQAGRNKVLKEKRKNVHAYVEGNIINELDYIINRSVDTQAITYNPYKYDSFVRRNDLSPIFKSDYIHMDVNNEMIV